MEERKLLYTITKHKENKIFFTVLGSSFSAFGLYILLATYGQWSMGNLWFRSFLSSLVLPGFYLHSHPLKYTQNIHG